MSASGVVAKVGGASRWVTVPRGGGSKKKKKKKNAPSSSSAKKEDEAPRLPGVYSVRAGVEQFTTGSVITLTEEFLESSNLMPSDVARVHGPRRKTALARVAEGPECSVSAVLGANLGMMSSRSSEVWVAGPIEGVRAAVSVSISSTVEEEAVEDEDAAFEALRPLLADRVVHVGDYVDADKHWIVSAVDDGDLEEAVVGADTEVVLGNSFPMEEEEAFTTYADLGGCEAHIETLREVLELPLHAPGVFAALGVPPPKGALVFGPSGCGKTTLARAAAFESGAHVELVSGSEIMAKKPGEAEEALRAKFASAEARAPAVVVIDEIESVGKKRDKASSEMEKRVTSQLLTLMDGLRPSSGVVVLAATSRPNDLDPALRRFGRLDREIELSVPDEAARLEILLVKTRDVRLDEDVDLKSVADDCHGFVGADIAQLCTEAALLCVKDAVGKRKASADDDEAALDLLAANDLDKLRVRQDHFARALKTCNPASLRESAVEVPDVSWNDVGGLDEVKQELKETVEYPVQFARLYDDFGLPPSKGVLFYGPPGCGKTLIAKAVANECGANFISVKGPELLTMWFGESEANVRSLFDKARAAAPCVLFFDEMDSIAKARSSSAASSDAGDRVMNQILAEIDAVGAKNVFVVGATNRPDILDPAVTRPGRLDQLVQIPLPDVDSRKSVFKAALRKAPVDPDVDLDKLAEATDGFSGADIAEICQRAAKNAVKDAVDAENRGDQPDAAVPYIAKHHFEASMARARRSVPKAEVQRYADFAKSLKTSAKPDANAQAFSFDKGFYDPDALGSIAVDAPDPAASA
ncbi:hypothetical protein CTAYLR_007646 [Chrysophaeum taylorii]|uniref:AAA+ ATPase domain-containing protein n=1 Tax=Chrysophaeum taylorii TaxID=2483200 RepID=A0AAD7U5Y2_9STRA|nr:hypothetical protein CTAYLR_007646 [Chrysophaeum taylorii]